MSKTAAVFGVVVAGCAGFFGGILGSQNHAEAALAQSFRGTKFELVNAAGVTRATWEVNARNEVHLRFLSSRAQIVIDIGLLSSDRPILQMMGRDGKGRINLELDESDKPMLVMSDERWQGRVKLGIIEPDFVSPEWDNWGLLFSMVGSNRPIAGIGMAKTIGNLPEGFLTVSGKQIAGNPSTPR